MKIPLTALMTEIIAKIMVELLSMLRQAGALIKRGRISERFFTAYMSYITELIQSNS